MTMPPYPEECTPEVRDKMRANGFDWINAQNRFLRVTGTSASREIKFSWHGKWYASAWMPSTKYSWEGEEFDTLAACYVAAELENWGGL